MFAFLEVYFSRAKFNKQIFVNHNWGSLKANLKQMNNLRGFNLIYI